MRARFTRGLLPHTRSPRVPCARRMKSLVSKTWGMVWLFDKNSFAPNPAWFLKTFAIGALQAKGSIWDAEVLQAAIGTYKKAARRRVRQAPHSRGRGPG